jgi:hypothetical protein
MTVGVWLGIIEGSDGSVAGMKSTKSPASFGRSAATLQSALLPRHRRRVARRVYRRSWRYTRRSTGGAADTLAGCTVGPDDALLLMKLRFRCREVERAVGLDPDLADTKRPRGAGRRGLWCSLAHPPGWATILRRGTNSFLTSLRFGRRHDTRL